MNTQRISAAGEEEEKEEEEEEEEDSGEKESGVAEVATTDATIDGQISLIKQGLNISGFLNGSDVRVGIIMARWNADIIQGLYKVSSNKYILWMHNSTIIIYIYYIIILYLHNNT